MTLKSTLKAVIKKTWIYSVYNKRKINIAERKQQDELIEVRTPFVNTYLPKGGIGAELGVFKGGFSPVLLNVTQAKKLHLIDPWFTLCPEWTWASGDKSTVNALIRILQKLKAEIQEKKVHIHINDDLKTLNEFPDSYFDWVYIDSSHAYEHTKAELLLLEKKVKAEGIISGDDWRPDPSHRHHGVHKAVMEFVEEFGFSILYANPQDLQWAIQKKVQ